MRTRLAFALLILAGCGDPPAGGDGGAIDAASIADGSAVADAGADGGAPADAGCASRDYRIVDVGHCFDARTCCEAEDCGPGDFTCNEDGLCEETGRACGCVDDLDCAVGAVCLTNAVVCGVCAEPGELCVRDENCAAGRCIRGYCVDESMCQTY